MKANVGLYFLGAIVKAILILLAPQVLFLVLAGHYFPPQDSWGWLFWATAECGAWVGFLALIAQLFHSSLPQWIGWDTLQVLDAFERTTRRSLLGVQDQLPVLGRLERSEAADIWTLLQEGQAVLVEGPSGTGKSGIAAQVVRRGVRARIPALFLNAKNYTAIVSNLKDMEHYAGVELSLRDCFEKISRNIGDCLVVIDQLDSAGDSPAYQVSVEILAIAKTYKRIRLVAVSSTSESAASQRMRELAFESVQCQALDRQKVAELLTRLGITRPSEMLVTLSENLFYLSWVAELGSQVNINRTRGKVDLLDQYISLLQDRISPHAMQMAIDFAHDNLSAAGLDIPLSSIKRKDLQLLQSSGLIIAAGKGLFRFRHEQLLYLFYALGAVERGVAAADLLERIMGRHAASILAWLLRLYRVRRPDALPEFLQGALLHPNQLSFLEQAALMDECLSWVDITAQVAVVEVILESLRSVPTLRTYFFRSNPGPVWAPLLWLGGFFAAPPSPEVTEAGTFLKHWDVQTYLESVAPEVPEIVIQHVESIQGDSWYIARAIRCLNRIPLEYAEQALPRINQWLQDPNVAAGISFEVNDLLVRLAENSRTQAALGLFQALTAPKLLAGPQGARRTLFGDAGAGSAFDLAYGRKQEPARGLELLKKADIQAVIKVLESNLIGSLIIAAEAAASPEREFASWWRTAIEDTDQDILETYEDRTLHALREAVEAWVKVAPADAEPLILKYLNDKHVILRRLGLYLLSRYSPIYAKHVARELLNRANWDDVGIHHELFLLLEQGFAQLSESEQRVIVSMILDGPNRQDARELAEWAQKERGADPDEFLANYTKQWIRDRLWVIRKHLPTEQQHLVVDLVGELGEPDHPGFLSWSTGVYTVRDISPVTEEEIARMNLEGLVKYLAEWRPDAKHQWGPERVSRAGLAGAVANVLLSDVEKNAPTLNAIVVLHPAFANAALGRWTNTQVPIEIVWPVAIQLCKTLLANDAVRTTTVSNRFDEDWRSARLSIAHLIEIGLVNRDCLLPIEHFVDARDILFLLVQDVDPDIDADRPPEGYAGYLDPLTVSLNHVRPVALRTLVQCAFVFARNARTTSKQEPFAPSQLTFVRSIVEVLTARLDKTTDPSRAVHSVFGEMLQALFWLDDEWVKANLEGIFPIDENEESTWYFVAAWNSFILNPYHAQLIELLRDKYERAIKYVALGYAPKSHLQFEHHLALHLGLDYVLSDYDIASPAGQDSLIARFLKQVQPEARGSIGWALWRICQDNPDKRTQIWARARALWEWRNREAAIAGHSPEFDVELEQLAQLLQVAPTDETLTSLYPLLEGLLSHLRRFEYRNVGWDSLEKFMPRRAAPTPGPVFRFYPIMNKNRAAPPLW